MTPIKFLLCVLAVWAALFWSYNPARAASALVPAASNNLVVVEITPTVDATPDYVTGDLIGGKLSLENAIERTGAAGIIRDVVIVDNSASGQNIDVVFFDANPSNTTFTENGAFNAAYADALNSVGFVQVTSWASLSDASVGRGEAFRPIHFVLTGGTTLYAAMIARGTINASAASDITLRVVIERS